jgi:hypothetical protein
MGPRRRVLRARAHDQLLDRDGHLDGGTAQNPEAGGGIAGKPTPEYLDRPVESAARGSWRRLPIRVAPTSATLQRRVGQRSRRQGNVHVEEPLDVWTIENLDGDDATIDEIEHDHAGLRRENQIRVTWPVRASWRRCRIEVSAILLLACAASDHAQPGNLIGQFRAV